MKILGLEFSSTRRSVAWLDTEQAEHVIVASADASSGGFDGLALVGKVLNDVASARGTTPSSTENLRGTQRDIDLIAVGLGPGSYTGIRTALSIAQGWQLAVGNLALGMSSVDCLAAQAASTGIDGLVYVAIDAQRDEFYVASYEVKQGSSRLLEPLRLVPRADVQAQLLSGGTVIGPDPIGHGSSNRLVFPDAATLVTLAAGQKVFSRAELLEPIYLRQVAFVKSPT